MILNRKSCCIELPFFWVREDVVAGKEDLCVCDFEFVGRRRSRGNIWLLVLPTLSLFKFSNLVLCFYLKWTFPFVLGP